MKEWAGTLRLFWKKWGFYLLAALCLLLIAGAAIYGRAKLFGAPQVAAGYDRAAEVAAQMTAAPVASAAPTPALTIAPALGWPVSGREILRDYAETPVWFQPLGLYETHPGVDIRAEVGEDVLAAADGFVTRAEYDPQLGYLVEAEADGLVARYGNLSKTLPVSAGDWVRRGQKIGSVGKTAPTAKVLGAFLHFEAFRGGRRVALP